ncbi:WS/DGAT domain-containing protein [Parahaliea mediterranea]|uniref:WS/DGAT domain-containing protein n=1 Tax=Parahaliea mediterranea TaxID=651086 RepID=UPI0014761416|nr:WS/DGAT domain-containing protein [Parahaliea mediterranea]
MRRNLGGVIEDSRRLLQTTGAIAGASRALVQGSNREMLAKLAQRPVTHLNGPLSDERRFVARTWPVEPLHRVRKVLGITFNDVGLLLFGGALRRYLDELDALPEASLVCNVPVALAASGKGGNAVLTMWVPIGTHIADAQERAAFIKEEAAAAKQFLQSLLTASAVGSGMRMPSLMVRAMALPLASGALAKMNPPPGNVALSNVPSPATPIHVAGALVESNHGMPMLLQGQAVGGTFTSYAGKVVTGLTCCAQAVPEPERILEYMQDEQMALERLLFGAGKPDGKAKGGRARRTRSTRRVKT